MTSGSRRKCVLVRLFSGLHFLGDTCVQEGRLGQNLTTLGLASALLNWYL